MKHTLDDQVPIAITMDDGTVTVMSFMVRASSPTLPFGAVWSKTPGVWNRSPSDANIFAEISKAFPLTDRHGLPKPQPVRYKVVTWDSIPKDRTYRNALRHTDAGFHHDMPHARRLHIEKMRSRRLAALGVLDRDYTRAIGQGKTDEAAAVEAKRQALRDAPQTLDAESAQTIDELKAIWPADLPR